MFSHKKSIPVTPLTHDVTLASQKKVSRIFFAFTKCYDVVKRLYLFS